MTRTRIIFSNYDDLRNPWYAGGGAVAIHEVAKRLAVTYEITVLTGAYPGALDETVDNVRYERVGIRWNTPHLGQLWFILTLPFRAWARRASFDLWMESFGPPWSISGVPLVTNKPVIGLVHMLAGEDVWRKYSFPAFIIERFGVRLYRDFIILTDTTKDKILRMHPAARVTVIPNGVTLPRRPKVHKRGNDVVYLGRIEINQKGIDLLIDGFKQTLHRHDGRLVIAGRGRSQEEARLQRLIATVPDGRAMWIRDVRDEAKTELLQQARCVVVPSRFETFGIVALEAMANNVPVVCFDIDGFRWIPSSHVMKVTPLDSMDLGNAIAELFSNEALAVSFTRRAALWVRQFSWEDTARRFIAAMERVVKRSVSDTMPRNTSIPLFDRILRDKTPCIFVSPHLDDAALSAGGTIAKLSEAGVPVTVATVFTEGGNSVGDTLSARRHLAMAHAEDSFALHTKRRREDLDAWEKLGVRVLHLGFVDALWRTIEHPSRAQYFFGRFIPEFMHRHPLYRLNIGGNNGVPEDVVQKVAERLRASFPDGERAMIFAPRGVDSHLDHVITRRAVERTFSRVVLWLDMPYVSRRRSSLDGERITEYAGHADAKRALIYAYHSQVSLLFPNGDVPTMPDRFILPADEEGKDTSPLSVAVVIPAYNEAANIGAVLRSLLDQREDGFHIKRIKVISDGSTDNTGDVVRSIDDRRVKLQEFAERKGKATCLQGAYRNASADITVSVDADTILAHQRVLAELIAPFRNNPTLGLASGGEEPVAARTLVGLAMNIGHFVREPFRGDNVFSADGKLMACRREFAKRMQFPNGLIGVDHYLYFACRREGFDYRYIQDAKIFFRSPSTLRDAIRQNTRFGAVPVRMGKYFGREIVKQEYHMPFIRRILAVAEQAVRHPVATISAFLIYQYCNIRGYFSERTLTSAWDIAITTKPRLSHHE